jgi:[ribosomal protein S18]-alanine N-acetyltransferase
MIASAQNNKIVVRGMREEDLGQVLTIEKISFSLPWPEKAYRYELLENPNSLLWVAEAIHSDGSVTIIGSIVIWIILDELHIATLAIHPNYRGMGCAKSLINTALREGIEHGGEMATLEVRAGNTAAQSLYKRFGFEKVGRRRRYYRDNNEDAIIMTLESLEEFRTGSNNPHQFTKIPAQN